MGIFLVLNTLKRTLNFLVKKKKKEIKNTSSINFQALRRGRKFLSVRQNNQGWRYSLNIVVQARLALFSLSQQRSGNGAASAVFLLVEVERSRLPAWSFSLKQAPLHPDVANPKTTAQGGEIF